MLHKILTDYSSTAYVLSFYQVNKCPRFYFEFRSNPRSISSRIERTLSGSQLFFLLLYGKPQQRIVHIITVVVVMKIVGGKSLGLPFGCLNYVQPFINVKRRGIASRQPNDLFVFPLHLFPPKICFLFQKLIFHILVEPLTHPDRCVCEGRDNYGVGKNVESTFLGFGLDHGLHHNAKSTLE